MTLRPAQARILGYEGGPLAISAVPGAGKTFILSHLAARLIGELQVAPSQILILTYMRSAARTFRDRVAAVLAQRGLSAAGLQATTIHAFCLRVVQRHAALSGDDDGLRTLSDAERLQILREGLSVYLSDPTRRARWERVNPPGKTAFDDPVEQSIEAALQVVSAAKNFDLSAGQVAEALGPLPDAELPWLVAHYHEALEKRRAIDFDDQVRLAIQALETEPALLAYYRDRYRYVLEDEAQDSTPAQNRLLELLTGGHGNLVRVGDSNQAITSTFTFNDPRYFREFCARWEAEGRHVTMEESSRSGAPVLAIANHLVELAGRHPDPVIARAFEPVAIRPATAGKPNPAADACRVQFRPYATPDQERLQVLYQVRDHLARFPQDRVAVLLATNARVQAYADFFEAGGVPTQLADRQGQRLARSLALLEAGLKALALRQPPGPALAEALKRWWQLHKHPASGRAEVLRLLQGEGFDAGAFLFPPHGLAPRRPEGFPEADYASAVRFLRRFGEFYAVRHQPPAEVVLSLAGAFLPEGELQEAAFKVAAVVRHELASRPTPGLADALEVVEGLRQSARRWPARSDEAAGRRAGCAHVMTIHRAKGAEFDAVWLPELGSYSLGRRGLYSRFPWEPEAVNLLGQKGVVARAAVARYAAGEPMDEASVLLDARREAVCEKLRLLYVGLTRAERVLTLTCSTGENRHAPPHHIQEFAARYR